AEAKHPGFEYEFKADIADDLTLSINEEAMRDVLANLFDNSLDAIKVKLNSDSNSNGFKGKITVTAQQKDKSLILEVHDNGIGFRPEDLPKACVPFFTTKGTSKGTGLGL